MGNGMPMLPGKIYLADAGYGNRDGILVPYKKVRYHLREQRLEAQAPKTLKELFNLRHAQLRNSVERVIGVLEKAISYSRCCASVQLGCQGAIDICFGCVA